MKFTSKEWLYWVLVITQFFGFNAIAQNDSIQGIGPKDMHSTPFGPSDEIRENPDSTIRWLKSFEIGRLIDEPRKILDRCNRIVSYVVNSSQNWRNGRDSTKYFELGFTAEYIKGRALYTLSDYHKAIEVLESVVKHHEYLVVHGGTADCYNHLANAHYLLGHNEQALPYLEISIKLFEELNMLDQSSFLLLKKSELLISVGNYVESNRLIAGVRKSETYHSSDEVKANYYQIKGNWNSYQGFIETATNFYDSAFHAYIGINLLQDAVVVLWLKGESELNSGDIHAAVSTTHNALRLLESYTAQKGVAYYDTYNRVISLWCRTDLAQSNHGMANMHAKKFYYDLPPMYEAFARMEYGYIRAKCWMRNEEWNKASVNANRAVRIAQQHHYTEYYTDYFDLLSSIYKSSGKLDSALYWGHKYDSITNEGIWSIVSYQDELIDSLLLTGHKSNQPKSVEFGVRNVSSEPDSSVSISNMDSLLVFRKPDTIFIKQNAWRNFIEQRQTGELQFFINLFGIVAAILSITLIFIAVLLVLKRKPAQTNQTELDKEVANSSDRGLSKVDPTKSSLEPERTMEFEPDETRGLNENQNRLPETKQKIEKEHYQLDSRLREKIEFHLLANGQDLLTDGNERMLKSILKHRGDWKSIKSDNNSVISDKPSRNAHLNAIKALYVRFDIDDSTKPDLATRKIFAETKKILSP